MARGGDFLEPGQVSSMLARNAAESAVRAAERDRAPLEVDSRGRGSDGDPRYHVLLGDVLPGTSGVIADTLNSDHLFTEEEGRAWLEKLAHRYNVHDDMLAALEGVQFAGPRFKCMECGGQPVTGHIKGCRVGAALSKAKGGA